MLDTIKTSFLGSVPNATLVLPFSVVASTNISKNNWIVSICRFPLNTIRTLPTLVTAKFAALIFSFKAASEAIEKPDMAMCCYRDTVSGHE